MKSSFKIPIIQTKTFIFKGNLLLSQNKIWLLVLFYHFTAPLKLFYLLYFKMFYIVESMRKSKHPKYIRNGWLARSC